MTTQTGQTPVSLDGPQRIPLDEIQESSSNPRRTFAAAALDELARSIAEVGVLQPVVVRVARDAEPGGPAYELVIGARRFRASKLAEREMIPAIVRGLDDRQVLELQLTENRQREDVDVLEEADGFRALQEVHGLEPDEIAERIGVSKRTVYSRLKLGSLGATGRKALEEGKLLPSIAPKVAALPEALQEKALDVLEQETWDDQAPSARRSIELLQEAVFVNLERERWGREKGTLAIPWKLDEEVTAELEVIRSPDCASCPARSGNARELFPADEIEGENVCTAPDCFEAKRQVWAAAQEATGKRFVAWEIPPAEGKAKKGKKRPAVQRRPGPAFHFSARDRAELVSLDANLDALEFGGKNRTVRQAFGKALETAPPDPEDGPALGWWIPESKREEILAVTSAKLVRACLKARRDEQRKSGKDVPDEAPRSDMANERRKTKLQKAINREIQKAIGARAAGAVSVLEPIGGKGLETVEIPVEILRILLDEGPTLAFHNWEPGPQAAFLERTGAADVEAFTKTASGSELVGLMLEQCVSQAGSWGSLGKGWTKTVADLLGVDAGEIEKRGKAYVRELVKRKARKKASRKKKPARPVKRRATGGRKKKAASAKPAAGEEAAK